MAKAWLGTIMVLVFFLAAYSLNLFGFLAERAVLYVSFGIMIVVLGAAFIILGNPLGRDRKDEKDDE